MNQQQFEALVSEMRVSTDELLLVKGGEYAGSGDRLSNFKRVASAVGITPAQACVVYMSKHWDSIMTFVEDAALGRQRPRSEPIRGRIEDLINYCYLLAAILDEQDKGSIKSDLMANRFASQPPYKPTTP